MIPAALTRPEKPPSGPRPASPKRLQIAASPFSCISAAASACSVAQRLFGAWPQILLNAAKRNATRKGAPKIRSAPGCQNPSGERGRTETLSHFHRARRHVRRDRSFFAPENPIPLGKNWKEWQRARIHRILRFCQRRFRWGRYAPVRQLVKNTFLISRGAPKKFGAPKETAAHSAYSNVGTSEVLFHPVFQPLSQLSADSQPEAPVSQPDEAPLTRQTSASPLTYVSMVIEPVPI